MSIVVPCLRAGQSKPGSNKEMKCKSILCTYSGDVARGSGAKQAARLANYYGAHTTGVPRHGVSGLEWQYAQQVPKSLLEELRQLQEAHSSEKAARFKSIATGAGFGD